MLVHIVYENAGGHKCCHYNVLVADLDMEVELLEMFGCRILRVSFVDAPF